MDTPVLRALFDAAVAAADPHAGTREALRSAISARTDDGRGWVIAVGKASARMAHAAVLAAADTDLELAGGVVVGPQESVVDPPLESVIGDHPIPGARSHRAAHRIAALAQAVLPSDDVLLLVSGGTSSLIAAPADGLDAAALDVTFRALLGAGGGVDIHVMNAVRRRVLQWGGGRLAAAVAPARLHQVLLSDVIGDDPATIASGPAVPDALSAHDVLALLDAHELTSRIDPACITYLHAVERGEVPETPKPGDPCFANVRAPVVLGRTMLHEGIEQAARDRGESIAVHDEPLTGEAGERGTALAQWLATSANPGVHCWTGETTVTLGTTSGQGGRCQEFALAASLELERLSAPNVTLLAAGTDGRDGPTDAAGAIVDATVPAAIREAGLDPAAQLSAHDAYPALDAARALLKIGHTGTNVADVLLALVTKAS